MPLRIKPRKVQGPAQHRVLINKQYLGAGTCGAQRCLHSGRTTTDYHNIIEKVFLVVVVGFMVLINHAQPRFLANDASPFFPDALWSEKGLVIEPDWQESRERFYPSTAVSFETTAIVLAAYFHVGRDRFAVGEHVRIRRQLYQSVRVLPGHGQNTARPMVLERSAQQPPVVSGQSTGDIVTCKSLIVLVLKAERNVLVAVQQEPVRCRKTIDGRH